MPPFVNALVVSGGSVYAALDVSTGNVLALDAATGAKTSSYPSADSPVTALALGGGNIYFAGIFKNVNATARNEFAAIDATSGTVKAWLPSDTYNTGWGRSIAVSGSTVYLGGTFLLTMVPPCEGIRRGRLDDRRPPLNLPSWPPW